MTDFAEGVEDDARLVAAAPADAAGASWRVRCNRRRVCERACATCRTRTDAAVIAATPTQPDHAPKRGLYQKFIVTRTDGRSAEGEKHHGCEYFVLDCDHDPHAPVALRAYAKSVESENPKLAADLIAQAGCVALRTNLALAASAGEGRDLRTIRDTVVRLMGEAMDVSLSHDALMAKVDGTLMPMLRAIAASVSREGEAVASGQLGAWSDFVGEVVFLTRATARGKGYALAVHGSLFRDLDVVAVPWAEEACSAQELAEAICEMLVRCGLAFGWTADCTDGKGHEKPLGRMAWSISLSRHDGPRYLDLSIAPRAGAPR